MPEMYSTQTEELKAELIEKGLKNAVPLIAVVCKEGVLFATASGIPGFRKIRIVHPSGLVFAGVGESNAIEKMASGLTACAHMLELNYGKSSVTAAEVIAHEERGGVLDLLRAAFIDSRIRPFIGDFLLAELSCQPRAAILHYITATGDRDAFDTYLVLGNREKVKEIGGALEEKLGSTLRTIQRNVEFVKQVWQQCVVSSHSVEFSFITFENPRRLQSVKNSKEKGG